MKYLTDVFQKQCATVLPLTAASIESIINEAMRTGYHSNFYGFGLRNCIGERLLTYIYRAEDGSEHVKTILENFIIGQSVSQVFGEMFLHEGYTADGLYPIFSKRSLL